MTYHRAPNPANMFSICCFVKPPTIISHQAEQTLRKSPSLFLFRNVLPRTGTKNRTVFYVKLSLILRYTVYELLHQNDYIFHGL